MAKRLRLKGEERGDYFHVLCADCGAHVYLKASQHGAVPAIEAECKECNLTVFEKLMGQYWSDWPTKP